MGLLMLLLKSGWNPTLALMEERAEALEVADQEYNKPEKHFKQHL